MRQSKKGASKFSAAGLAVIVLLGVFLASVLIAIIFNYNSSGNIGDAIADGFSDVGSGTVKILSPLFNVLIGLEGATPNVQFLKIITMILITVILVSVLDSFNLFGDSTNVGSKLVNFVIGFIVAIIGVRFMPPGMWESLTAPSSAFVAVILVAVPFAALFFITNKITSNLARKLMWIFYLLFMTWLIFTGKNNQFKWIYLIFIVLAAIMMFFDSTVRGYMRSEKIKLELVKGLNVAAIERRLEISKKLKGLIKNKDQAKKGTDDRKVIEGEIKDLKEEYADLGKEGSSTA